MYAFELMCMVILLPIIPAFCLFKALPSNSGNIRGKLQGLEIKLGGAFAGYFAVLVLVVANHSFLMPPPPPPPPPYQVWEVSGRILNEKGRPLEPIDLKDVSLIPASFETDRAGFFRLRFYSWPDLHGGYAYPRLTISHDNYESVPIPLNPEDPALRETGGPLRVTINNGHIDLHDISLKPLPTDYPNNLPPLNKPTRNHSHGGQRAGNN